MEKVRFAFSKSIIHFCLFVQSRDYRAFISVNPSYTISRDWYTLSVAIHNYTEVDACAIIYFATTRIYQPF